MSKQRKSKHLIPRFIKNPKAVYRWCRVYLKKVKMTEEEIGGELDPC